MSDEIQFGIVAALEREIAPLIADWRVEQTLANGRFYKAYVSDNAVLMLAGMGRAFEVTKVLVETYAPKVLISTGFAGSLVPSVRVGSLFMPASVVAEDSAGGFRCELGKGRLVTARGVADAEHKRMLAERFAAEAVDMEAAQVAEIAAARGCEFIAVKAISDSVETDLSFVSRFVDGQYFRTGAFVAHIAVRPWLWSAVNELKRNSVAARRTLCEVLKSIIREPAAYKDVISAFLDAADMQPAKQVG